MLGNKRNRNQCAYGCCRDVKITRHGCRELFTKARERKIFRAREKRAWKKEEGE